MARSGVVEPLHAHVAEAAVIGAPAEPLHLRHAGRIEALAREDVVLEALGRAGIEPAGWVRSYARLHPEREGFATLVLGRAGELVRVEAFEERPSPPGAAVAVVPQRDVGWLSVTRLPLDPELAALPSVLHGGRDGAIVRYRPYRRCTVRLEGAGGVRFAKVFSDGRARRLFAGAHELWRSAEAGELDFSVPRPIAHDPSDRVLWLSRVGGVRLQPSVLRPGGEALAGRLGAAAASVAGSSARPRRVFDGAAQLATSTRRCAELARLLPGVAGKAQELVERARALHDAAPRRAPAPVHGDMTAGQWLAEDGRLGLLDLDHLALGDPELDVATFVVDVAFRNPARMPVEAIGAAFAEGYASRRPELDRGLLGAYLAHRALRKALLAAHAVRPRPHRRVERRLDRGLDWLAEAGA